ncbi:MAG: YjbE family putative metal transport protein [Rhodopila sp.]|jgi:YjbE family integral membrane protein
MMSELFEPAALSALLQVIFVNVVLSADNALVIGMASLGLPARQRLRALWLGIAMATLLRIGFAVVATTMLQIIGLLLAGGILLLWVGWKLWREIRTEKTVLAEADEAEAKTLRQALWQIIVADVSMSLDNVLAVAGAAVDYPVVLAIGLGISVLLMGFAASAVARLIERYHWVAYVGLAVILYIAVRMIWDGGHDVFDAVTESALPL